MKALITGDGGQLARSLSNSVVGNHEVSLHPIDTMDITSAEQVEEAVNDFRPDVIINTAAYTAVDRAESDEDMAHEVNARGPGILAQAAMKHGARLIHVSTDFVFDGASKEPWRTDDPTNPISVYGRTKLGGERAIIDSGLKEWTIVRTAWLYGANGANFVSTMIRLMNEGDEVSVVSDQMGTPTFSDSLAVALWCMAEEGILGMHHWTDSGETTWHGFATAIEEIGFKAGLIPNRTKVHPITTEEHPTPARRPKYSVMDKSKTWRALEGTRSMPAIHWRENLETMITEQMRV